MSNNLRTEVKTEISEGHNCDNCGYALHDVDVSGTEKRLEGESVFVTTEHNVTADVKMCPQCRTKNTGVFLDHMPEPRQYGSGIVAYDVAMLCARLARIHHACTHNWPNEKRLRPT